MRVEWLDAFVAKHLQGVSRTYAILVPMLPDALADAVGVAYLLMRVVDTLANDGRGLNLTYEVRDGIVKHSKGKDNPFLGNGEDAPETMEGKIVRAADIIAYVNHDLEDALQAGLISLPDLPGDCLQTLGSRHSQRINTMVTDIIHRTLENDISELLLVL